VINAPIGVVWSLLTNPARWGDFFDIRITRVEPPGPTAVGHRVYGESGPHFLHLKLSFEFTHISLQDHELRLNVRLPLGVIVREELNCVPLGVEQCRANYHCNFELTGGWRGWAARTLPRREIDEGPADSLSRLKRAAERASRARV
jgi:hypothetical protein